jgi:hypothetical protein
VIYEVLFAAASATLSEFGANPRWLGGKLAFSLVLHTWKQDLGRHVPVHALVAGGALTSEGEWKSPKRGFLFPVQALSRVFRGKFLAALSEARGSGRPLVAELADEKVWLALRQRLLVHDWVVYAKQPLGGPEQVLEYLGRYTHRVAISNERLVGMDETTVRFRVRAAPGKRLLQLPAEEFIDRFLLPRAPQRFQADSPLRPAGPSGEGDEAGAGTAGLVGTPTRSGDHGDGGGLPAARRPRAVGALSPLSRGTVRADGGDSAPASGDAAECTGSRTPMKTVSAWRGAFPCAQWQFRPPGDASSAACRSNDSGAALCLPQRPVRSCHALANSRKPLVCLSPSRLTPARGLTPGAGRLQSP